MAKLEIPRVVVVVAISFLLALQQCCQASMSQYNPPSIASHLCHRDESIALLQLKKSSIGDYKMASWKEGVDCCSWEGVACDSSIGHIVGVDLSCDQVDEDGVYCRQFHDTLHLNDFISHFPYLQSLNLASNDFNSSTIPSAFGKLIGLTHLNLSNAGFFGKIPPEISHLNNLVSLDLSYNDVSFGGHEDCSKMLANATKLSVLHLQKVNMTNIRPSSFSNLSHSLTHLDLSNCGLVGEFPENVFRLPDLELIQLSRNEELLVHFPQSNWSATSLKVLDASYTDCSGQMFPTLDLKSLSVLSLLGVGFTGPLPSSFWNLTSLTSLDLSTNSFSGKLPPTTSPPLKLEFLDISVNSFSGPFPSFIFNMPKLQVLYCSNNQLDGPLSSEVTHSNLSKLYYVESSYNFLNGTIPPWLLALPSLGYLSLSYNQLSREIPEFRSSSLKYISLDHNQLSGIIPISIFNLVNVFSIELQSNKLTGVFHLESIMKLKYLDKFSISDNDISVISYIIPHKFPHSHLQTLELSSCNITSISTTFLDSHPYLHHLNLSHNFLNTINFLPPHMEELTLLDLSYNLIQGLHSIPWIPSLYYLSVANNKLIGTIPLNICYLNTLGFIDLSRNNLSGSIPECLANATELSVLNLKMNNFNGLIPATFGNMSYLNYMDLNGNKLRGSLPQSMTACKNLEILDVGNNQIRDVFPQWVSSLPLLKVLILHSNSFNGPIMMDPKSSFPTLRILDLSNNYFNGRMPANLFRKLSAMMILQNYEKLRRNYYSGGYTGIGYNYYSFSLTVKGYEMELDKVLTTFTTVDLSNNYFHGPIPDTVGELKSLLLLNLSHNSFIGPIPSSLGNLTELESLDLSSNQLTGEIPSQLTSLTNLGRLNLSQNSLQGPIPQARHFDTFDNSSFIGNQGLCGVPLSKKCEPDHDNDEDSDSEPESDGTWFNWAFAGAGYGCGLVIGISTTYIMFSIRRPRWLVDRVEIWISQLETRGWRRPITFKVSAK